MGYKSGQKTLSGRAMTLQEQQFAQQSSARDAEMGMQYGGVFIGGQPAPAWMAPHAAIARQFAAENGRPPSQQELTSSITGAVNGEMEALRQNPEYQQADRAAKIQMEAEAVSGRIGMDPQNAASFITELRQGTEQGRGASSPQDIMQAAARWMAPSNPSGDINNAMNQLRSNPQYQQADGATKRQMEAQSIARVVPGLTPEQATQVVTDLRSGSAGSNTLSSEQRINEAVNRARGPQTPQVYGQGQNQLAPPPGTASPESGSTGGGGGGINYGGSGQAGGDYNTPMSPAQRALVEGGRQFDVGAQLDQRKQDIDKQLKETDQRLLAERQAQQKAIEDGNLDLARQHEANITNLEQQRIDISKSGQDADIAIRAAETMGVKSATDTFQSIGRARSLAGTSVQDTFNKFQGARGRPMMDQFTGFNAPGQLGPPGASMQQAQPVAEQTTNAAAYHVLGDLPGMNAPEMQQQRQNTLQPPDQFGMSGHAAPNRMINPVEGSVSASMGIGLRNPTQMRSSDFSKLTGDEQGMLESAFMDQTKSSQGVMGQLMNQGNPTNLGVARRARMRM
jgi:hypothetical protein